MVNLREILGDKVRWYRDLRAMTQRQVADKAGISLNYLGYVERGARWPSPETLVAIAEALATSPDQLISISEAEEPEIKASLEAFRIQLHRSVDEIAQKLLGQSGK